MIDTEERPVLAGLVALAAVALVIGVLAGVAIMLGAKSAGIGGDSDESSGGSTGAATMVIPDKLTDGETEEPKGATETEPEPGTVEPSATETTQAQPITLSAAQVSVSPMQQIDLTGTYPTGEGAILQVQRMEDGAWTDFPVTVPVSGQQFGTYVMTSRPGPNKFRVIDTDTQQTSNPVEVTVG